MRRSSQSIADLAIRRTIFTFIPHPHATGETIHYGWHIEILPKTSVWAGFELSTGIEVLPSNRESRRVFARTARCYCGVLSLSGAKANFW